MSDPSVHPAAASGTFSIGGDPAVHRLGYGAMQEGKIRHVGLS